MKDSLLFVDDESGIINALIRLFRKEGYEMFIASSGEEALEVLRKNNISLIISDYRMPGMNGVEFFSKAKEICPAAIRIMLTGYADLQATVDAINRGEVYRFIAKPWNDDELKMTVKEALHERRVAEAKKASVKKVKKPPFLYNKLEQSFPGITRVDWNDDGTIIIDEHDFDDISINDLKIIH